MLCAISSDEVERFVRRVPSDSVIDTLIVGLVEETATMIRHGLGELCAVISIMHTCLEDHGRSVW